MLPRTRFSAAARGRLAVRASNAARLGSPPADEGNELPTRPTLRATAHPALPWQPQHNHGRTNPNPPPRRAPSCADDPNLRFRGVTRDSNGKWCAFVNEAGRRVPGASRSAQKPLRALPPSVSCCT